MKQYAKSAILLLCASKFAVTGANCNVIQSTDITH